MNRKEAMRLAHQEQALQSLGFTADEADKLRRISMTLRRWYELECGDSNGYIERDETTGKTYWASGLAMRRFRTPDRETGARKRLAAIIRDRNQRTFQACGGWGDNDVYKDEISTYIQTDPRGAALYILRPGDIPEGQSADSCYSRGICVY